MSRLRRHLACLLSASFLLVSCVPKNPPHGTVYDSIQRSIQQSDAQNQHNARSVSQAMPDEVSAALMPVYSSQISSKNVRQKRFDITADEMPARQFFMGLVEGTPVNMTVHPGVTGNITLHLKNVTLPSVMQTVQDVYGYSFRRTGRGYEVLPRSMENGIFNVNYLNVKREGKSLIQISTGQISEKITGPTTTGSGTGVVQQPSTGVNPVPSGGSVNTRSEMDFWKGLGSALSAIVGVSDGRSVSVNPEAGVVMVHAYPNELRQVGRYLDRIQSHMGRQVVIEAKILEVRLNDNFQSGINWNMFGKGSSADNDGGAAQTGLGQTFEGTPFTQDFSSIFTLNAGKGRFAMLIQMLQTQGNVQVLSSPRISTVNNQKAVIKVGTDQFFVTGVSTDNTVTANSTIPTQNVSLTPFFSGVTFDVTPEISGDDEVILHIHPSISKVTQQTQSIQLGQTSSGNENILILPLALSTIRESDNVVRARNGQVVVIGGLMQDTMSEDVAGVPGLSKLPFIGALFRNTSQVSQKSELVILLRPVITDDGVWDHEVRRAGADFRRVKRGFHIGGLPEVFGTEAEGDAS